MASQADFQAKIFASQSGPWVAIQLAKKPLEKSLQKPLEKPLEISYTGKTQKMGSLDMS